MGRPPSSDKKQEEKRQSRIRIPPTWAGMKCMCCGKIYPKRIGIFAKSQSHWFDGNDGFVPWCNDCKDKIYEYYVKKYGDEDKAIYRIAMMFDLYCGDKIMESANKGADSTTSKLNIFIGRLNIRQFTGKTFDDYLDEEKEKKLSQDDIPQKSKVTQKMIKFWGEGYDEREYLKLEEEYTNLITRHECKTAAQELLFKRIACAVLNCEKADMLGNQKNIKEANDNLQNLMDSAKIKPKQTSENVLAETNTLGTLIQKWEETRPIPEPDPAWADVDGISRYFRVWVLGTILNMFKLKNPFQKEYEEEMEIYTASKKTYEEEDESSGGSIRDIIFASEKKG